MGGDDYLVKPFQAPELKARIRAPASKEWHYFARTACEIPQY